VKTLLICFSQSGNTKKIADCIKTGMMDVIPRCDMCGMEQAGQADWEGLVKMAPKLYERYRFWLDRAAEEGRFHWRVDPDSIDFDRPFYLSKKGPSD